MFLELNVPRKASTNPPSFPHPPSLPRPRPPTLARIALVSVASSKRYARNESPTFPKAMVPGMEDEVEGGREEGEKGGREREKGGSK